MFCTLYRVGNLDLLLTNSKNFITDITVFPDKYLCKSDHYLITFEVKSNVKHKKVTKRKILNFKKADWDALNNNLGNIHWDTILDCMEPEIAWLAFKHTLFSHIDKYIPSVSVKSDFTSPWFDSECFEAYREKERAHKKFKENSRIEDNTQNIIQSDIKFKHKRQLFKNIWNREMRDLTFIMKMILCSLLKNSGHTLSPILSLAECLKLCI